MFDSVVVCVCLLLVGFGLCFGLIINFQNGHVAVIRDVFEYLSFAATIAAAGVAIYALTAWRNEFRHNKLFECLSRLKNSVESMDICSKSLRYFMHYNIWLAKGDSGRFQGLRELATEAKHSWLSADKELHRAIDECELFVGRSDLDAVVLLHAEIAAIVFGCEMKMLDLIFEQSELSVPLVHDEYAKADSELTRLVGDLKMHVIRLRQDAFKIK
jgi:hypothetical protein